MKRKQWLYLSGLISLFLLILSISDLAHSASKPDWIEGKSRKYPSEQYLTGVCYGDDRKAAEDSAFAAIANGGVQDGFFKLGIPLGQAAGSYSQTITFTAECSGE